jgi:predicted dienelactone hydrolase
MSGAAPVLGGPPAVPDGIGPWALGPGPASVASFRGRPAAPDELGPWAVGHTSFQIVDASRDDRPLPIEAWYPADPDDAVGQATQYALIPPFIYLTSPVAIDDIPVLDRPWLPLVVFSHGSGSLNIQSTGLMEILASHGFVVVAPSHTGNTIFDPDSDDRSAVNRPLDVSFLIDHMLARSDDPQDAFYTRVSPFAIGVVGHSFGGYTTLAMAAGLEGWVAPDPRVRAIVPISAVTSIFSDEELESIRIPTMFIGGTFDTVVPIDPQTVRGFELVSSRFLYRADIVEATHSHFANICDIGNVLISNGLPPEAWPGTVAEPLIGPYNDACIPEAFPIDEARRIQNLYTVAFFRRHLVLDPRYGRFLKQGYAQAKEPDVIYFDASRPGCGRGFEMALIVSPLMWIGGRRRRATLH